MDNLNQVNKQYWQAYKPGEIPSIPRTPPEKLLSLIKGPILDMGTGDGTLAEKLSENGFDLFGIDIAKNIIEENLKRKTKVHYSFQDITTNTQFPDNYFELLISKFMLTNIHKESWSSLSEEVFRITQENGKVWILEPLVSDSYSERYELSSKLTNDKNVVYVFKSNDLAEQINTKEKLKNAIRENKVSRIVKHYTIKELKEIFKKFKLTDYRIIEVTSPSGYKIKTFEGVFIK